MGFKKFIKKTFRKVDETLFGPKPQRQQGFDTTDPANVQFDPETGLPIGLTGPPSHQFAHQYQWRANETVARRNAALKSSAGAYLDQGMRTSESYRPGGYASFDWFRNRVNLALQSQIEAPDLMAGMRAEETYQAAKSRRRSSRLKFFTDVASTAVSAATGGMGNPAMAAGLQASRDGLDNGAEDMMNGYEWDRMANTGASGGLG